MEHAIAWSKGRNHQRPTIPAPPRRAGCPNPGHGLCDVRPARARPRSRNRRRDSRRARGGPSMRRIAVDLRDVGRLDRGRVDSGNFEADVQDRQATATKIYDLSRDLTSCQRPEVSTLGGGISITIPRRLWGPALVPAYPFSAARSEDWKMGASLRQSSPRRPMHGSSSAKSYPIEPCHRTDPATLTRSPSVSSPPYMHCPC